MAAFAFDDDGAITLSKGAHVSQERTRFPIQPTDRRRTARSSRDVLSEGDELAQRRKGVPRLTAAGKDDARKRRTRRPGAR